MFGALFTSQDVVSSAYAGVLVATFSTAILCFLGLSWVNEKWRAPVAMVGVAALASSLHYVGAASLWLTLQKASGGVRFSGWFTVHPLQVAAVYFYVTTLGKVPVGVFWRMSAAALLMVFSRYLGDAGFFNPTFGVLLSIGFWLYILGEMYFGAMTGLVRKASRPVRFGYFWIRLIFTIGWAIYPILHFVDVVIGTGQASGVIALYTLFDLVNLITPSLIVLAVAGQERY
ncbi:bacteriorhodopsin-like [Shinella sp. NM-101]|uniref:bacteriorhodopsin-like n=1 Tax=Shinella sp. NM-101 TaxID=2744455 RepID=UPI001F20D3F9|nr:bacteriorhodopsin-like [Shinella sp. NM-101]